MRTFTDTRYQELAAFRSAIRAFLHFSEQAARVNGLEPQQHQLLLAVKGLAPGTRPTITALSERLYLRHHSVVELVNRMVEHGVIRRRHGVEDRREALVELTPAGEEILQKLSILHWEELQKQAPKLIAGLQAIVGPGDNGTHE